ncbi:unnamed protein product [Rotaria sp. Silwood1]|nr:unnamed protein product [Rotaria sp. Silwood1]
MRIYDQVIIPVSHRMSNLEQLSMYLLVDRNNGFIDEDDLQQNIINYMPRLNEFWLYSRLTILLNDQIISCVNCFQEAEKGECHIYS